jgi:uncharacterized protein YuzB (UPF0349 family)
MRKVLSCSLALMFALLLILSLGLGTVSAKGPVWTAKPGWDVPSVGEAAKPAFADLDNDGDYDLLISERFGVSFGYENMGNATSPIWTAKPDWGVPCVGMGAKPAFADLDNDGDYDLMIGEGPSGISYAYENTGNSTSPIWTEKTGWNVPSVGRGAKPAFADLDNDGDYDLLVGEGPFGRTFGYENTGNASSPIWTAKPSWNLSSVGMGASPALADLDDDGDYDLLIGERYGISFAYENTGSASSPIWTAKPDWNASYVGNAAGPALADLDGDGDYDLLIGTFAGFSHGYVNTEATPTATSAPVTTLTPKLEEEKETPTPTTALVPVMPWFIIIGVAIFLVFKRKDRE